jgi:hypothetical protein
MEQWRIEHPQTLDVPGVRRLNVRIVAGNVDVVGRPERVAPATEDDAPSLTDEGTAHIEVTDVEGTLVVTLDGGTLTVAHERLTWGGLFDWVTNRRTSAVISVSVPATCPVELGVVSAEAVVSGTTAHTTVRSVSGGVTLDGVRSDIAAQTVSGDLEARGLVGGLNFTTVSGDLTVVDGTSARVRAETVSGQVTLDLDTPEHSSIDMSSVSGDLTVRLPDDAALNITVRTMSGGLDTAFDGFVTERRPGRSSMQGSVGGGTGRLDAKTVSGDVTILRRDAHAPASA